MKNLLTYKFKKSDITAGIIIFFLLYVFIYNPPFDFLPIGPIKFLYPFALIYIISNKLILTFYKTFKKELFLASIILVFSFIRGGLLGSTFVYLRNNFSFFFESFVLTYFIAHFYCRYFGTHRLEKIIIVTGVVASFISCFLILNPSVAFFVNNELLSTKMVTDYEYAVSSFRRFGLAEGLTFGYGVVQGIILSMTLYFSTKNKWLLLLLPTLFISILFNARSGFVPIVLTVCYILIVQRRISMLLWLSMISIIVFVIFRNTSFIQDRIDTFIWGFDFIQQFIYLFEGTGNSSNNYLLAFVGPMLIIPDNVIGILLGEGINIFSSGKMLHSDVGYIQQLNFGGVFYIFLLFYLVFYMAKRVAKLSKAEKWFRFIFLSTILLMNIKGYFLWPNSAIKLLFLMYVFYIACDNHKRKCNENSTSYDSHSSV